MSQPYKKILYSDPLKLKLHVYVVGYPVEGESILVIVAEEDKALLTIVTDCYEASPAYNHVSNILNKEWNSAPLNAFVWTHPHKDHSLGIKSFVENHDKERETHIIGVTNSVGYANYPDVWNEAAGIQKYLLNRYAPQHYHFKHYDPYEDCRCEFLLTSNGIDNPDLNVALDFVAPPPAIVAGKMNNKNCIPNTGSLAYLLSVNGVAVFMGGDLDEVNVPYIDDEVFKHVNLVKIPHHGSEHTGDIHLKFGLNDCDKYHAVTTVFVRSSDPKASILQGYVDCGAIVHCTGPLPSQNPVEPYGCLHYVYNLASSSLEKFEKSANAYQFLKSE